MSQRSEQVAEELRKIVSMILLNDLSDSRLGFVTVTRIHLTEDLRYAKIFYSVLGEEAQKKTTEEALAENMGLIKKMAVERINMRYAMEIRFEEDRSIEYSLKIDQILRKIKKDTEKP